MAQGYFLGRPMPAQQVLTWSSTAVVGKVGDVLSSDP